MATMSRKRREQATTAEMVLPCACPQCGVRFAELAATGPDGGLAPIGRRALAAALAVRDQVPEMAATAREVATALGISPSAATTNLLRAVAAGIVRAERTAGPRGGVRNVYHVAPLLAAYAPRDYAVDGRTVGI